MVKYAVNCETIAARLGWLGLLGLVSLLLNFLAVGFAVAWDSQKFIGTWYTDDIHYFYHNLKGDHSGAGQMTVVIKKIHSGVMHVDIGWGLLDSNKNIGDHAGARVRSADTQITGIMNFDGKSAQILGTEDNGIYLVQMIDDNHLHVNFLEQGHNEATVYSTVLTRLIEN